MQSSQVVAMYLEGIVALSVVAGAGAVIGIAGTIIGVWQSKAAEGAAESARAPRLEYEVVTVPTDLAAEFQKLHPLLHPMPVFLAAVLGTPACSPWHESLRHDAHRHADQNPGKALFVKVKRMP